MKTQKIITDNQVRIETGAVEFDQDWPGLFIRGDDCMLFYSQLKQVIDRGLDNVFERQILTSLLEALQEPLVKNPI